MYITKSDWSEISKDTTLLVETVKKIRELRSHLEAAADKVWSPLSMDALVGFLDELPSEKTLASLAGE